jgi:hypothetical protein
VERTYRGGGRRGGGARGHHGGVEFGGWTGEREAGAERRGSGNWRGVLLLLPLRSRQRAWRGECGWRGRDLLV